MHKKIISFCSFFAGFLIFTSCDPGHIGNSYIHNQSSYELRLTYHSNSIDTSSLIQPDATVDFYQFGGIGAGVDFDCCPCEFETITLQPTDTSKHLLKAITNTANWTLTNENKKRFDNKSISCEFQVAQSDIQ